VIKWPGEYVLRQCFTVQKWGARTVPVAVRGVSRRTSGQRNGKDRRISYSLPFIPMPNSFPVSRSMNDHAQSNPVKPMQLAKVPINSMQRLNNEHFTNKTALNSVKPSQTQSNQFAEPCTRNRLFTLSLIPISGFAPLDIKLNQIIVT
jgi:hypothetical protein